MIGIAQKLISPYELKISSFDTVSGSGALNGQLLDSGHTWELGGTGYLTTSINVGGYIEGTDNTYCFVNTGKKIYRAIQLFSGTGCTISIGLDTALTDMIHVNFSAGSMAVTYWKTGIGTGQTPQVSWTRNNGISLDDDTPHELIVDVFDNFVFGYIDGDYVGFSYDENFTSIQGNYVCHQIHDSGDKIYGCSSYTIDAITDDDKQRIDAISLVSETVRTKYLLVGDPAGTGFDPSSISYFHTVNGDEHIFSSAAGAVVHSKAVTVGAQASVKITSWLSALLELISGGDGNGYIQFQGVTKIKFPANTARVDLPSMRILADGLPTSPSGLSSGELWVDTTGGFNIIKRV